MIEVKEAVVTAGKYLEDMFAGEKIMDVRLEEVELSENDEFWHITLSFLREPKATSLSASDALRSALGRMDREYKVVAIRSQDGQVQSMKIRQPA